MVKQSWFASGTPWVWLTAGAVSISLISVFGLLLLIASRGLTYFWSEDLYLYDVDDTRGGQIQLIGEYKRQDIVPTDRLAATGITLKNANLPYQTRHLIHIGNRDTEKSDFVWVLQQDLVKKSKLDELVKIERLRGGHFFGVITGFTSNGELKPFVGRFDSPSWQQLQDKLDSVKAVQSLMEDYQLEIIGTINYQLEQLRLQKRKLEIKGKLTPKNAAKIDANVAELNQQYLKYESELTKSSRQIGEDYLIVENSRGEQHKIQLAEVLHVWLPNQLSFAGKLNYFFTKIKEFLTEGPRDGNISGGVFPAIFGTVLMVLLMSVLVTPLGVIAALYLHEYAKDNALTRFIRIAVINLAGVPSIVYGVFGLGFFVYLVGGTIDQLLFGEALPSPTFGTPGVLWSAMTLAILTLPVVIVSTEEGLRRIPVAVREGSLSLGATKAETIWHIVLPLASPAIMTGLILAVARAAGEVAPLMMVGVVKFAATLPVDAHFPYLHLERKFMHLGYHIYDVGFQSSNVESARPLVYATSFLLVSVILILNITAIYIRNRLRENYRSLTR